MDSRSGWLQMVHLREWRSSEAAGAEASDSSSVFIGLSFGAGWPTGVFEYPFREVGSRWCCLAALRSAPRIECG